MRLAVVSPFLDRQHGTELCIIEQIERFVRLGQWSVDLYSQRVSELHGVLPASLVSPNEPQVIRWHRISDIPGPHLLKYLWWFFANYWRRWQDMRAGMVRPDLVYSPGINCPDADVIVVHIVFHEFYKRVKSELTYQRVPPQMWPRALHRKLYYKLAMFLERKFYCDPSVHLVAVSSLVAAQLKSHFQREDVSVIPNAVDTLRFSAERRITNRNASRRSFLYEEHDFVLLLIGNDWKKKGLDTLIKATDLLSDLPLHVLVVGGDDPSFYGPLLERHGLQDRIRFERPSSDVLSFYAAADLYVGPSLEDAFNLPILEAMACGLPVIASANAGASEMIRDGATGFILRDPRNSHELATLIRKIQTDSTLRLTIGAAASRYAMSNCSWDDNAEKTKQLLESILMRR